MPERQRAETFPGVSVGLLSPADALFDRKTAALQYHFRRALEIAHQRVALFHCRAHELVRTVERQRTATGMLAPQRIRLDAAPLREFEQSQLERIAGAGLLIRVIAPRHRPPTKFAFVA